MRRVCSRVTHTRLFLPGVAERNYRLCHISMRGGCRSFPAVTAACRLLAVSPDRYTFLLPSCALSPEARSACTSHEHWIWCRRQDSNLRTRKFFISELYPPSFCLHIAPSGRSRSPAHQEKKGEKKKNGDAEFAPAPPRYHIFFCCCISLCNIT